MRKADIPAGMHNPLDFAVTKRDAGTMDTVRRAIQHRQVLIAYQPVVQSLATESVAFYEALLRVIDETGRVIPAADFIEAIEETEIGRQMDCIALEKGLHELAREPWLRLAVNMSARSIGYGKWMKILNRALREDPTIAERLILEITEHSAITVPELVVSFMDDIQARGVSFAIDDFGAGYTALRHFKDLNFDILKIDGQFVRGISEDPDNQVLVRAMISIAEQFDLFTVAESVENASDAQFLATCGVDCMQGYHFGAPTIRPAWRENKKQGHA